MLGLLPEDVRLLVNASDPRLSPDATMVSFSLTRVDLENNRYISGVWIVAVDGSSPAAPITPDDVNAHLARWSPDGASIAYSARARADEADDHPHEISGRRGA